MAESYINPEWDKAVKKVDVDFEGSIFQKLGLTDILCPTCEAHCSLDDSKQLICLNACHLIPASQAKFHQLFVSLARMEVDAMIRLLEERKGGSNGKP